MKFDFVKPLAQVYEKIHDSVDEWNRPAPIANDISKLNEKVIDILYQCPGMMQAHSRDFKQATPRFTLRDGSVLKTFINPMGVHHVFIANSDGNMVFGGFVFWRNAKSLKYTIAKIKSEFT